MFSRNLTTKLVGTIRLTRSNGPSRFASSLVTKFDKSVESLPLREAVRYVSIKQKLTAKDFLDSAESHANALLDHGFKKDDVLAMWSVDGMEKDFTKMAAAKAGMRFVDIDPSITDIASIREFLKISQVKALYFFPHHDDKDFPMLLRKAIPELFYYDNSEGQFFHSKFFPKLKFFISMGRDNEYGCLSYQELFLPHPEVNMCRVESEKLTDDTPFYAEIRKNNGVVSMTPFITHGEALSSPAFSFVKKYIDHEYYEF
mmetsp:Transcript_31986/g.23646  ORF Transcript_31986/g.23646 Transcript_31986/m.23646 type:complete len:258 (+) Transcript_31986:103-876(+)